MATQSFTLTVQPPASGPTIRLHKVTNLLGNYQETVSGSGWNNDSSVTVFECASTSYAASHCDLANADQVTLNTGDNAFDFKAGNNLGGFSASIRLAVGVIDAHKDTCGLLGSRSCFIVAVGSSGDSVSSQALGFKVPTFSVRKTMNLQSGYVDPIRATGLPIGDSVVVRQCRAGAHGHSSGGCATINQVIGTADGNGKVQFDAAGIQILVGRDFPVRDPPHMRLRGQLPDPAHRPRQSVDRSRRAGDARTQGICQAGIRHPVGSAFGSEARCSLNIDHWRHPLCHVQVIRKLSLCVSDRFRLTWLLGHERTLLIA